MTKKRLKVHNIYKENINNRMLSGCKLTNENKKLSKHLGNECETKRQNEKEMPK